MDFINTNNGPTGYNSSNTGHTAVFIDDHPTENVEGRMTVSGSIMQNLGDPGFNTLDEPIKTTIMRDLKAVGMKFKHVLYPKEKNSLLKEWDLWGPLMLCTFMAMVLQGTPGPMDVGDGGPEFAEVFVIIWIGSIIITLNSKLLGGTISFFQSVCVLGYCLLPIVMALIACRFILMFQQTNFLFFIRFAISIAAFLWSTYASIVFLGDSQPQGKKALAVYPIFLFYFIMSWLVLSHTV
ncbi:protein YIPF6 [Adelges cooleyi]|uniref:protein YIPF6 n=1 Tax=Adelges cooleyi TaxID=133065 RepID=UPI00217F7441|nr:protein YIPF6 [Adelges cooleyi]